VGYRRAYMYAEMVVCIQETIYINYEYLVEKKEANQYVQTRMREEE